MRSTETASKGTVRNEFCAGAQKFPNIIDITKIDAGFMEIHPRNYDICSLAERITFSASEYVKQKSMELQFETEMKSLIIACDADMIERILLNLLSNAVKFTPKGG